jgi:hypothetical protein
MNLRIPSLAAVHGVVNEAASRGHSAQPILEALKKPLFAIAPEAAWLLIALGRHVERQEWVGRIVEEKLGRELGTFGQVEPGAAAAPPKGVVPGHPAWEYVLHGAGCTFTHRVDGDTVHVDFVGGACDAIDAANYTRYLQSLRRPQFAEARLRNTHACRDAWQADLAVLSSAELIYKGLTLRLTDEGRAAAEALAPLAERLEALKPNAAAGQWQAAYLAAALGDAWMAWRLGAGEAATQNSGDPALEKLESMALASRRERAQRLRTAYSAATRPREKECLLQALADLGRQAAESDALACLDGDLSDSLTGAALDIVAMWNDPALDPRVVRLVERAASRPVQERDAAFSAALRTAVKLLLKRRPSGASDESLKRLLLVALTNSAPSSAHESQDAQNVDRWRASWLTKKPAEQRPAPANISVFEPEDALLVYLLDARLGLARLASALESDSAAVRENAAIALAAIDDSATRELLLERLGGAADSNIEVRAALSESSDPKAWRKVNEWEAAHPDAPSADEAPAAMRTHIDRLRVSFGDFAPSASE